MNSSDTSSGNGSSTPQPVLDSGHQPAITDQRTLLGHPTGLYTLFFAEMWERFSYYGMRALLVFYMLKGFLKYQDEQAYSVYGAYTALVYMTPFFGGMLADRLLGCRRSVVIGGILMALGHLLMVIETATAFYFALALLIVGNGFFKPNISTIVGSLYAQFPERRDAGFTIFYIGINLGAAMSPLLCGYIGETYGWHWGFGLATIGMLAGLAVFVFHTTVTQLLIGSSSLVAAAALVFYGPSHPVSYAINLVVAAALLVAGVIAVMALSRGGLPPEAGSRPGSAGQRSPLFSSSDLAVYAGILVAVPIAALFVSGFSIVRSDGEPIQVVSKETIASFAESESKLMQLAAVPLSEVSKPAGLVLTLTGLLAFGYLIFETFRLDRIARERMWVVLILIFFAMLFFSFFEQAGSSVNNFTDRNVDRVIGGEQVTAAQVGTVLTIQPTQEQLGFPLNDKTFTLTDLDKLRADNPQPDFTIQWPVTESHVGMSYIARQGEMPASVFQAVNPLCILFFGLVLSSLWTILGKRGLEPSTPIKFAFGLLQLGLGFGAFWLGAKYADDRGIVAMSWLLVGYLFQTLGELCLSPVGLSMIVKLTPLRLVSTVMGGWFLATAFSQYLAAIISQFTGVSHGGEEGPSIPPPSETVDIYGNVFLSICVAACVSALICFVLAPFLTRWMHEEQDKDGEAQAASS